MKSVNQQFEVKVSPGTEGENGQVRLPHGAAYTIELTNHSNDRCNAVVHVDGEKIGECRVNTGRDKHFPLSRHGSIAKNLVFFKSGTPEAKQGFDGEIKDENKGLITVEFIPEDVSQGPRRTCGNDGSNILGYDSGIILESSISDQPESKTAPGMTALAGSSSQTFIPAPSIPLNYAAKQVVHLRLVCDETMVAEPLITPLPGRQGVETAVPPMAA